jgi:hypothetical protein
MSQAQRDAARRYEVNDAAFVPDTAAVRYWTGFLLADGCLSEQRIGGYLSVCLMLALAPKDAGHIEAFRTFIGSTHPIERTPTCARLRVVNPPLVAPLVARGLTPRKSLTAKLPDEWTSDRDAWRGVVDGDGWLCLKTRRTKRSGDSPRPVLGLTGSAAMVGQFRRFAAGATGREPSVFRNGSVWSCVTHGAAAVEMARVLYHDAPIALPRKAGLAATFPTLPPIRTRRFKPTRKAPSP